MIFPPDAGDTACMMIEADFPRWAAAMAHMLDAILPPDCAPRRGWS